MNTYDDDVYTPGMIAEMFRVSPRTVTRWSNEGRLRYFKTPGGHRRFHKADVDKLLEEATHGVVEATVEGDTHQ